MTGPEFDTASFKDPDGRVFVRGDRVFRALTEAGVEAWQEIRTNRLLDTLEWNDARPVKTWESSESPVNGFRLVLEHERIPFLSYPYEWPFSLLRTSALLHLEMMTRLLPKGRILKDATPYNVQFDGMSARFIDVLSISRHKEGDPWASYGQFCDTHLYPLMLDQYKGVPFHAWLRGSLQGLPVEQFSALFSWLDLFKPGVFKHVKLRASLHSSLQDPASLRRSEVQAVGLPRRVIENNVSGLRRILEGMKSRRATKGSWVDYANNNSYAEDEMSKKKRFVDRVLSELKPAMAWDIGCNTGEFSLLAARHSGRVVAFDRDSESVDRLAEKCAERGMRNVLPLVIDFSNPSPGLGWACAERKSLFSRGKADVVLALALVHHLAVGSNVPLALQLSFLSGLSKLLLIEYVDREDPMFQRLMINVGTDHAGYNRAEFLRQASRYFSVESSERLSDTREIFALRSLSER